MLVSEEHGKVLTDAAGEVARGLECVEFACGVPQMLKGSHSSEVSNGVDVHTVLHPVGVVAGITPFNFPVMVPMWMMANALACGNAFILKPSEKDPSPSLLLAELVQEAGFPDGVFNVRAGRRRGGRRTPEPPRRRRRCRSWAARRSLVTSTRPVPAMENGSRRWAEPRTTWSSCPTRTWHAAADAAVSAAFGSAGERCMAISVVVAVGTVGDRLVDAIATRIPGGRDRPRE